MNRAGVILGALALASCSKPPITCGSDGMIIVPAGLDDKTAADWNRRNLALALDRLDQATGFKPQSLDRLVKAEGCP